MFDIFAEVEISISAMASSYSGLPFRLLFPSDELATIAIQTSASFRQLTANELPKVQNMNMNISRMNIMIEYHD